MTYKERLTDYLEGIDVHMSDSTIDGICQLADDLKAAPLPRKEVISIQPGEQVKLDLRNTDNCEGNCTQCNVRCMYRREDKALTNVEQSP
jgi:hypothetical protein